MLVKLDDEVLFSISEEMIKLMAHDVMDPISEIKNRLKYIIEHKCDQCYSRLHKDWSEKFQKDPAITSVPSKKLDFLKLVFSHSDYKNRLQRNEIQENR